MNRGQRHENQRWFIYALGGGLGHLHRSLALARAAVRQSRQTEVVVLTNSPYANCLPISKEKSDAMNVIVLDPILSRDETVARVKDAFKKTPFDRLIVDTFPRGLGGELPGIIAELRCPKVLVHRDLNPRYIEQANLSEVSRQFDKIVVPGEAAPFETMAHAVRTAPWLIRDSDELLSPVEARRVLKANSNTLPIVAVVGSGKIEEVDEMHQVAEQLDADLLAVAAVRFMTPQQTDSTSLVIINLWPLMEVLPGVSVVVGSGGYNTVQETKAVGVPLIGLPRQRLYDSQRRRLEGGNVARNYREVRSLVEKTIGEVRLQERGTSPDYQNGVHLAVELISSL